ncbi:threonyl-tRNA synthetase [Lojkania enalia]|uniref:threonine--tRNA ligase n=1 Tax=Lojkania enalia TaxID=147567 RepID=A0A9P4JZS3_9PLEO|nr:threonyl-tRNA synthetase [Didymosphaeria enalia]
MPALRPPCPWLRVFRSTQLLSKNVYQPTKFSIRSCSCSAPHQFQNSVTVSTKAQGKNPQLNPTTSEPPTPPTDHRSLAQAHGLFITSPYSPGSPLLLPNGAYVFQKLQSFLRAQYPQFGFQEVITPTIYKKSLWEISGHWDNYAEDMFSVQGRGATGRTENAEVGQDEEFGLKPMNCPGHCLLFGNETRSHRDLPVRLADFSALHRNEISGALTGLTRVRRFHQDDAHIFCRPDQILAEIEQTLKFVGMVYDTFGLGPYKLLLSTRPLDHFIGTIEEWDRAEMQLTEALINSGREFKTNKGDGAFYGPKIDIILKDSNGKEHQTATIQLDFQLPQRFNLQYQASPEEMVAQLAGCENAKGLDNAHRRPVIIHRAIYGSLERFMALLIEHYAGTYPFWLSPRPAIILVLNQSPEILKYVTFIQSVLSGLRPVPPGSLENSNGKPTPQPLATIHLPIDVDASSRGLGKKIAEAFKKRYNHFIIVGPNEARDQTLKLEMIHQPNIPTSENALSRALGRDLQSDDYKGARISIDMSLQEARHYFETLVNEYL